MQVKQLIEILQKIDPNAYVYKYDEHHDVQEWVDDVDEFTKEEAEKSGMEGPAISL